MRKPVKKSRIFLIFLLALVFTTVSLSFFFVANISALPFTSTYFELAKVLGAFSKQDFAIALFGIGVGIASTIVIVFIFKFRTLTSTELFTLMKGKILKIIVFSLVVSLLFLFFFSAIPILGIMQQHSKIYDFVAENADVSLHEYINKTEIFLNNNVNNSWDKQEDEFEIDGWLYSTLLDPAILNSFGLTRADVILYQGWGSCGQEAFVIEELLHRAGYTTRRAHFIGEGADHGWAEVNWNGSWFIVNPWWLGKWVEISNLRWEKPAFQNYTTVEAMYRNGTNFDLGADYGY